MTNVQRLVRPELRFKSATNEWSTPDDLWKPLDDEFGFTLDVCSTHENAKCVNHYTLAEDGLAQPWSGVCWMNPPYGAQLARWVKKCYEESRCGALVVGLIPVRSNTSYWHNYAMKGEIRFVRGYPKFGNAKQGLKAPLAVVVWRPDSTPSNPLLSILQEIQQCVEDMPCGGIGENGATQTELDEANERGCPVESDAMYHQSQQAWLIAQRGIDLMSC